MINDKIIYENIKNIYSKNNISLAEACIKNKITIKKFYRICKKHNLPTPPALKYNNVKKIKLSNMKGGEIKNIESKNIESEYNESENIQSENVEAKIIESENIQSEIVEAKNIQSENVEANNLKSENKICKSIHTEISPVDQLENKKNVDMVVPVKTKNISRANALDRFKIFKKNV